MIGFIKKHHINVLQLIFILSFICTGVFHEYYSCVFSVLLIAFLFVKMKREKQLEFRWNTTSIAVFILIALYGISIFWAIDSGMAFIGFLKFLPVLLFVVALMQEKNGAERIITILPYTAVILIVLSVIGMVIPATEPYFAVAERLAGTFQYPNTFALFLLVSELVMFGKEKYKIYDLSVFVILTAGLLLTGSRTVFLLALVSNGIMILANKNKKIRVVGLAAMLMIVVGIILYVILFDGADAITRLFKISFAESTFVGRILYFVDALPVILKSPFGLGYLGYFYIQQSIQTGLYSVRYIHNDFLQIMLDVGWIPCVFMLIAIIKNIFDKKTAFYRKVILSVILLHSCFDFNLQFIAMFFLLILFMDCESGKVIILKKRHIPLKSAFAVVGVVCLWCGISLVFSQMGKQDVSLKMYPWNTQVATMYLTEIEDIDEAGEVADTILKRNEYVTLAYSAKARQAYAKGDFGSLITYKNALLNKAPYQYEEYEDYCYMLINGITLYAQAGDSQSADICKQELLAVPDKLKQAENKLSKLGKMIKDQPVTELPEDVSTYINKFKKAQ